MSGATILGVGQVSACGAGIEALEQGIQAPPPCAEWVSTTRSGDEALAPVLRARPDGIAELVPPRSVRRLDGFAKNFIYAARQAILDSGREIPPPERIGVVTGTAYCSLMTAFALLDDILLVGDDAGSPFKFTTAVNNASATSVATFNGARGPCLSVLGFSDIILNVLRVALAWLDEGRVDMVIAGAGDEFHPMIGYGLEHLGGWSPDGRVRPLDFEMCSYVPGETFTAMVLTRSDDSGAGRACIEAVRPYSDLARQYRPEGGRPLLLAADGRVDTASVYHQLIAGGAPAGAYAGWWGGNPSAEGLNLLVAALLLERGRWLGAADGGGGALDPERVGAPLEASRIDCVIANGDGSGSVITVAREPR